MSETKSAAPMHRVISFAAITGAGFFLGQISGLVREMVVSAQFGLSADLDAYFIARLVPTLVNNIVAGSAIGAAIMPILSRELTQGRRDEFWHIASIVTNLLLLITGVLTALGIWLAPLIISILAPTLPISSQQIAATLLVIMMPTLLLGGLLNMLLAMLNALDRFTAPALIFLALNLGIILTVIVLTPTLGIYSVGLGFLIGVMLQVAVQLFELRREQPRYSFGIDWHHPALRATFAAFLPITALSVIAQINLIVDRSMASSLATGSVGALSYADTVLGIFYMVGISLGIAVFPSLSRMAAINDAAATARTIVSSIRLLIFILTPITLLVILFGSPLVGLLLGRGRFDAGAVQMTADALGAYAVGLIAIAAIYVLQRAFFAMTDNVVPFVVGFGAAIFHIGLNWLLMQSWAHAGIALSTSITALATALVLLIFLSRRLPEISLGALALYVLRCALLAAPAAALAFGLYSWVGLRDSSLLSRALGVSLAGLGSAIYIALALVTRMPEGELLLHTTRHMLGRFKRA